MKKESPQNNHHFIQFTILGLYQELPSQSLIELEEKFAPRLFKILPKDVCTVFVGRRMRYDRNLRRQKGEIWTEKQLQKFADSLITW